MSGSGSHRVNNLCCTPPTLSGSQTHLYCCSNWKAFFFWFLLYVPYLNQIQSAFKGVICKIMAIIWVKNIQHMQWPVNNPTTYIWTLLCPNTEICVPHLCLCLCGLFACDCSLVVLVPGYYGVDSVRRAGWWGQRSIWQEACISLLLNLLQMPRGSSEMLSLLGYALWCVREFICENNRTGNQRAANLNPDHAFTHKHNTCNEGGGAKLSLDNK